MRSTTIIARVLSTSPLVFLGRISYGLYLYHVLIRDLVWDFASRHNYGHSFWLAAITAILSMLAAWLSFRFYEQIFLRWGRRKANGFREEAAIIATAQGA